MKQYITFHGAPSRNNLGDPPKFDNFIVARGTFEYTPQQAPPPSKTGLPEPPQLSQLPHSSQFSQTTPKRSSKNPNISDVAASISNASNASASQSMWRDAYGDGGSQLDPELLAWVQARESSLVLAGERLSKLYDGVSFKDEEVEDDYDRSIKDMSDEGKSGHNIIIIISTL